MTAHTTTDEPLTPELEAIATAAAERLRAEADAGLHDQQEPHRRVARAASAAIAAGLPLAAIADAERIGQARTRDELRPDALRQIGRLARRKRETETEYEQAVIRAARLGLAHREIGACAGVAHATVRTIIARTETPEPAANQEPTASTAARNRTEPHQR